MTTYGLGEECLLRAEELEMSPDGTSFVRPPPRAGRARRVSRCRSPDCTTCATLSRRSAWRLALGIPMPVVAARPRRLRAACTAASSASAGSGAPRWSTTTRTIPTEVAATLAAARQVFPRRVLHAVFQPHLYSRTRDLAEEFGRALSAADHVVVTDVYPSRERPIEGVTGELVARAAQAVGHPRVDYCADWRGSVRRCSPESTTATSS